MTKGKVILAGAGPGDVELVTVKLIERLKTADVLLIDRLVNPQIVDLYAPKDALVIPVGKQGYDSNSITQNEINNLIVEHALQGKTVIRLKGGDVAIYSNVLDEILAITYHDIPFEIIPGITAASGAVATLRIPLTGRDIAPGVQIHSLSVLQEISDDAFAYWAKTNDTLVFYMSIAPLKHLLETLIRFGINRSKSIAVIEQATTSAQKNYISTLIHLLSELDTKEFSSPAIVIIGDILTLATAPATIPTEPIFRALNKMKKNQSNVI